MSMMAWLTCVSLISWLAPPTKSAAFSFDAIQRAAALVAPLVLSAKMLAPWGRGV